MPSLRPRAACALVFLLVLFAQSAVGADSPFLGRWQGTLEVGAASLRLRFDIATDEKGDLNCAVTSIDQSAQPIRTTATAVGDSLHVDIPTIRGSFAGRLDQETAAIVGHWSQGGRALPLTLRRHDGEDEAPAARVDDQPHGKDLLGSWIGPLKVGALELRVQLNVSEEDGELRVTFDSIDQGAKGIPARIDLGPGRAAVFAVPAVGGRYEAVLSAAGDTLAGTWSQGPQKLDLVMTHMAEKIELVRPQEPKPPFPYQAREVTFPGGAADVTLAGTLTVPEGEGPFPAVVLVSGSGPQNRDEELMGHKPFLVLADALTRRGIAVLRYDDRGTASSTGSFTGATSVDFADDAEAAVTFLRAQPGIDGAAVGVAGHSEGGLIAPMVAARVPDLGFVVLLAGPGVDGREILRLQTRLISRAMGETEDEIAKNAGAMEQAFALLAEEPDDEKAAARVYEVMAAAGGDSMPEEALRAEAAQLASPWMRFFLHHDPADELRRVKCPVLAINGGLDLQVDAEQNLPAIRAALAAGGNTRVETHVMPGLNHLFQTADTGAVAEYGKIEETMAPTVLTLVADWILKTTGRE